MMKTIDINEVERSLPNGKPSKIRGLNADGDGMSSTIAEVVEAIPLVSSDGKGLVPPNYAIIQYSSAKSFDCNNQKYNTKVTCFLVENGPIGVSGYKYIKTEGYSPDWMIQKLINVNTAGDVDIYIRSFYNGNTWSPWKKISFTS